MCVFCWSAIEEEYKSGCQFSFYHKFLVLACSSSAFTMTHTYFMMYFTGCFLSATMVVDKVII